MSLLQHMTTGKTIALYRQIFVGKVMCLLLNTLSRLVIALDSAYRFVCELVCACVYRQYQVFHFI